MVQFLCDFKVLFFLCIPFFVSLADWMETIFLASLLASVFNWVFFHSFCHFQPVVSPFAAFSFIRMPIFSFVLFFAIAFYLALSALFFRPFYFGLWEIIEFFCRAQCWEKDGWPSNCDLNHFIFLASGQVSLCCVFGNRKRPAKCQNGHGRGRKPG